MKIAVIGGDRRALRLAELLAREGVTLEMVNHAVDYRDYILEQRTSPDDVLLLETRVDFSPWVPEGFGTCDAILIRDGVLTIVDYKFGHEEEAYRYQLRRYARLYRSLGYEVAGTWIWYVEEDRAVPV